MQETYDYPEIEESHWYDKQWLVAILIIGLFPLGLYGLYKSDNKKGILLKFSAVLIIALVIALGDKKDTFSGGIDKVQNSRWDGSVEVAEKFLKRGLLKDPSSYESIDWSKVLKNQDGSYQVTHTFRAKNSFGGMGIQTITFIISSDGRRIIRYF